MIIDIEKQEELNTLIIRWDKLLKFLKLDDLRAQAQEIKDKLSDNRLWQNSNLEQTQNLQKKLKDIERKIEPIENCDLSINALKDTIKFCNNEQLSTEDLLAWSKEIIQEFEKLKKQVNFIEISTFLSMPMDKNNAIITVHSGAGGTEACDWANMILRMYMRWAERKNYEFEIQSVQDGEEVGISSVTFSVKGLNAYGYLKAERGVHRLVRISPFDANRKRHTSFCSVDVIAELNDDINIPIDDKDVRIDVYRSSGKGGQHVNKTESAVRITHFPSGIVVTCQNERSQIKNKARAMDVLKARLYERMQDEKRSTMERFYGEKGEIGWGYQIRSYVFQPYQMVKDLRTNVETSNVQAVMDGDIDQFIEAWLRAGQPKMRQ